MSKPDDMYQSEEDRARYGIVTGLVGMGFLAVLFLLGWHCDASGTQLPDNAIPVGLLISAAAIIRCLFVLATTSLEVTLDEIRSFWRPPPAALDRYRAPTAQPAIIPDSVVLARNDMRVEIDSGEWWHILVYLHDRGWSPTLPVKAFLEHGCLVDGTDVVNLAEACQRARSALRNNPELCRAVPFDVRDLTAISSICSKGLFVVRLERSSSPSEPE